MIFEGRQQKGLSLIEIAMVIILSVVFISGGSYIISLFKVFAQSCVVATDMNSVRNIIVSSDVEYK
ncbi:TPA: bundle-forming pilus minor pilin BfpK, partial [Escherichia coli]|nr:bundle-forming pilus minor pilin BfpK [Escherichia coli]